MSLKNKIVRYVKDFGLRISASVLTTFANQIVLLPMLASMFSSSEYGTLLTIVGVKNIISGTLGNSLYSTRLVVNEKYETEKKHGDFNRIIIISSFTSVLAMIITMIIMGSADALTIGFLGLITAIYTFNAYASVWYTVKLEFKKGLFHSITVSVGTLIGVGLVYLTHFWPVAYLCSALAGTFFIFTQTGILSEGKGTTPLLNSTLSKWFILIATTLLTNLVTYLDRLILYPLIGSEAVAIYSTASYFGKAVSIIAMPIASVMLGYYAQKNFKMDLKRYWTINGACGLVLVAFALFSMVAGHWVTGLLFPSLVEDASPYIFIANMSAATAAIVQIVQAASLKYAKTYWQIVIQLVYLGVYFFFGVIWMKSAGLMGFCYASITAIAIRLAMLLIVCHMSIKHKIVV